MILGKYLLNTIYQDVTIVFNKSCNYNSSQRGYQSEVGFKYISFRHLLSQ